MMGTPVLPSNPPPPPPNPPASNSAPVPIDPLAEALRFYQIATQQVTECRTTFQMYYLITVGALGIVIAAGFYMFGHEYSSLQRRADDDFSQLSHELRTKIQQRIDNEFSTESMQRTIHDEAVRQVKTAVTAEVSKELASLRSEADSNRAAITMLTTEVSSPGQKVGSTPSSGELASLQQQVNSNAADTRRLFKNVPLTWTISLVFSDWDAPPNTARTMPNLATFVPSDEIIISRIVVSPAGNSYVDTANGPAPCSNPPIFTLSAPAGARKPLVGFALTNETTNIFPLSLDVGRSGQIVASVVMAFDKTRICHTKANTTGVGSYNVTVEYSTTGEWNRD